MTSAKIRLGIGTGGLALEQWRSLTEGVDTSSLDTEILGLQGTTDHSEVLIDRLMRGDHDGVVVPARYLPVVLPEGLEIAAVTRRRTPYAAFLTYDGIILDEFETGAVIGVEDPTQAAQLIAYRPELRIVVMAGSLRQRLKRLEQGEIDALVLPASFAEWMHIEDRVSEILSVDVVVPHAGQGSLGLVGRTGENRLGDLVKRFNDRLTRREVEIERETVRRLLDGGASLAATLVQQHGDRVEIDAMVVDAGGRRRVHRNLEAGTDEADALAERTAGEILAAWATED